MLATKKTSSKTKKDDKPKQSSKTKKDDKPKQSSKTKKDDELKYKLKNITEITSPAKIKYNKVTIDPTKLHAFEKYKLKDLQITKQIKRKPYKIFPEIEKNSIIFANVNNNGVELTTFDEYLKNQQNIKGGFDRNLSTRHALPNQQQINNMNQYINNTANRFGFPAPIIATLDRNGGHDNIYFEITAIMNDRLIIAIYADNTYANECMHITCLYNTQAYVHLTFFANCNGGQRYHIYYMVNPDPNSFMDELIQFIDIARRDLFGRSRIPPNFWTDRWLNLDANEFNNIEYYMIRMKSVLEHYRDNN